MVVENSTVVREYLIGYITINDRALALIALELFLYTNSLVMAIACLSCNKVTYSVEITGC